MLELQLLVQTLQLYLVSDQALAFAPNLVKPSMLFTLKIATDKLSMRVHFVQRADNLPSITPTVHV